MSSAAAGEARRLDRVCIWREQGSKAAVRRAHARASGADTLITTGSVQSNHARVTAAVAAKLGMKCILVVNGVRPVRATGNMPPRSATGCARSRYVVRGRIERSRWSGRPMTRAHAAAFHTSFPLGASTPMGAVAFVAAIDELGRQIDPPTVIIHSSSSGGTQAGPVAGWHTGRDGLHK
jgi:D-cysteine desulfhydrase